MNKNRVLILLLSSIFILSAVGCSSVTPTASSSNAPMTIIASEDYPSYASIGDLSERANTIVKGSVIETRVEAMNDIVHVTDAVNENELTPRPIRVESRLLLTKSIRSIPFRLSNPIRAFTRPGRTLK